MRAFCSAAAVFLLVTVAGCGSGKPAAKAPPATPDAAVLEVTRGLAENKPEVVWQSLPPSYQKDVNDVIASFAAACDPDLYKQSFGIGQKLVKVLQTKKDLIITHPMLAQTGVNTQQLAQNWEAVINIIAPLLNSELSDLSTVKTLDVEKFLSVTGAEVMKNGQALAALDPNPDKKAPGFKAQLLGLKATQTKTEGDTVFVKIEPPGEPAKEERFVKVENRWIPKDMASEWKQGIAKAKAALEKAAGQKTQNKDLMVSQLKTLDGVLDQMLAAKTAAEFNNSLTAAAGAVMGMAAGPMMQQMRQGGMK